MRFDSAYWGWCCYCELDHPPLPSPTTWMSGQLHRNLFCWLQLWSSPDQHQFANPFTLNLFFVHLSKHTLALYPGAQLPQIGYHLSSSHDMPWKTDSEHDHHQTTAGPPPVSYGAKQRTEDAVTCLLLCLLLFGITKQPGFSSFCWLQLCPPVHYWLYQPSTSSCKYSDTTAIFGLLLSKINSITGSQRSYFSTDTQCRQ